MNSKQFEQLCIIDKKIKECENDLYESYFSHEYSILITRKFLDCNFVSRLLYKIANKLATCENYINIVNRFSSFSLHLNNIDEAKEIKSKYDYYQNIFNSLFSFDKRETNYFCLPNNIDEETFKFAKRECVKKYERILRNLKEKIQEIEDYAG